MAEVKQEIISNLGLELGIYSEKLKEFEKRILDVGVKEKISTTKRTFVDWAFLVHDFNRMHVFPGYASEANFKKTPIHGTRTTAFEEQYILGIKKVLEEFTGSELYYNGHKVKFEAPLFPGLMGGVRADWDLEKAVVDDKGIKLEISATDGKQEKYLSSSVFLGYEKNKKSSEDVIEFLTGNNLVYKTRMEIKEGERDSFSELLNIKKNDEVYLMHPSAFIPATLLELSSRRTGRPEGAYRGIDFEFYNSPGLGIFETNLKMSRPPRELPNNEGVLYKFEALCLQNKKPILGGKVNCVSPTEYKLSN
jgi:hypothetical protein